MHVRKITARLIYTLTGPPLENGWILLDGKGVVLSAGASPEGRPADGPSEYYDGIVVPGFVNCHCHLELSHLRGRIAPNRGMGHFLGEIYRKRSGDPEAMVQAACEADRMMELEGTVAAGDISNTALTLGIKQTSRIRYFTFIETFGFSPGYAGKAITTALALKERFDEAGLPSSVVPHSPYSVSRELFARIGALESGQRPILSMHNQESPDEDRFFRNGDGPIANHIRYNLGLETQHWSGTGQSSLAAVLPLLPRGNPLLLVHNTHTAPGDLGLLKSCWNDSFYLVLCPNSNRFIGGKLPPVELFRREGLTLCLGTDSLASNRELSLFSEVKTLHRHFPGIPQEELFRWACLNGAAALGMDDRLGSLSPGKTPGLVCISPIDTDNQFTTDSRALRIA